MRRLFVLVFLNVSYSTTELFVGLFSGRIGTKSLNFNWRLISMFFGTIILKFARIYHLDGLVSDAFHLTFMCGLLSFSLFAMAASQKKPDRAYTYGYERLAVLAAFTNAKAVFRLCHSP